MPRGTTPVKLGCAAEACDLLARGEQTSFSGEQAAEDGTLTALTAQNGSNGASSSASAGGNPAFAAKGDVGSGSSGDGDSSGGAMIELSGAVRRTRSEPRLSQGEGVAAMPTVPEGRPMQAPHDPVS